MKEMIRKFLVSLKKNPQVIPLLAHTVAFCIFSLNLTAISNTTNKMIQPHMGLCSFVVMLLSILAYVCLFSAYPKRQKPNWIMIAMILVMYGIMIFADLYYRGRIIIGTTQGESPIKITAETIYIAQAYVLLFNHVIATAVSAVLIITEPIYAKLLKKINTSVEVEDNGNLGAIELSDEE